MAIAVEVTEKLSAYVVAQDPDVLEFFISELTDGGYEVITNRTPKRERVDIIVADDGVDIPQLESPTPTIIFKTCDFDDERRYFGLTETVGAVALPEIIEIVSSFVSKVRSGELTSQTKH